MALLSLVLHGAVRFVLGACGLLVVYHAARVIYNLFFHPLAAFPGPIIHRASPLPRAFYYVTGQLTFRVADIHAKHGRVVRIAPNELAFLDPQAWKDIFGHKQHGQDEFPKFDGFYRVIAGVPTSILSANREEHGLLRRQLAHGFSDRSMRGQEPIIGGYVDLLVRRIREHGGGGAKALNMREWLNWTTFDIIGDLGFGSPFGCLEACQYHPWVHIITNTTKIGSYIQSINALVGRAVVTWISNSGVMKARGQHRELVRAKVRQRMELQVERPDLIEGLLRKQEEWQMPIEMVASNASTLIIAGSETTATSLSGTLFLLTTHPDKLDRLVKEVRSTFKDDAEITLTSVSSLSYMLACLDESLRRYPPVALGMPRVSPPSGGSVAGHFVPPGTVVSVWQWPINHDPAHWTDPMGFHPERFMGDPRFKDDHFEAMQPFSTGPRNCIGRNLAYAEMRLILAKIIFNFDMRIADDSRHWLETQKTYILWEKPPLNIYMTPVARQTAKA